jgi:hypothetical protein
LVSSMLMTWLPTLNRRLLRFKVNKINEPLT